MGAAVAFNLVDRLIDEICDHMAAALDQRLQAAEKVLQLREQIEARGDNWAAWFEA